MKRIIAALILIAPAIIHAQYGPDKDISIARVEAAGKTCKVTAFIAGNSTPWILFAKKGKDCSLLAPGEYKADLRSNTYEEGGTEAHFHNGWHCYGDDCYDSGTYLTPAQSGAIKSVITFDVKAGRKTITLYRVDMEPR